MCSIHQFHVAASRKLVCHCSCSQEPTQECATQLWMSSDLRLYQVEEKVIHIPNLKEQFLILAQSQRTEKQTEPPLISMLFSVPCMDKWVSVVPDDTITPWKQTGALNREINCLPTSLVNLEDLQDLSPLCYPGSRNRGTTLFPRIIPVIWE